MSLAKWLIASLIITIIFIGVFIVVGSYGMYEMYEKYGFTWNVTTIIDGVSVTRKASLGEYGAMIAFFTWIVILFYLLWRELTRVEASMLQLSFSDA